YLIWQVIQNSNVPVSVTTDTNGMIKVLPSKTVEEVVARERERKAMNTLLMALPKDHLEKFHKMADAKEMWEAIKSRFSSNDESKKMQKYLLKQQFKGFSVSSSKGLYKGYDRFQTLSSQLEIHGVGVSHEDANHKFLSFDDLYNNLRVFEHDVKGTTASSSSNTQNVAFVFADNTSSINDINDDGLEEMDLKCRRRDGGYNGNKARENSRRPASQDDSKALVTIDGEVVDWSGHVEEDTQNFVMMAYSSSKSGSDNKVQSCSKACADSYARLKKLYDEQRDKLGDASVEIIAYTLALKKVEAQLLCH
nr:ribonuclease H-like domain-containing protein [Tanacetum cinerariifolium]